MACKSCAHVVLVPTPYFGHCIPFFQLASRLAHIGVKVTILAEEELVPEFYNSLEYKPHLRAVQGKDVDIVAVKDGIFNLRSLEGYVGILRESSEAPLIAAFADSLSPLMSSTESPVPCCIISDFLAVWTQPLAAKFGIPRFILHIQSTGHLSLLLHAPTLVAEGRLPLTESNQDKPVEIPGFKVPVPTSELPSDLHSGAVIKDSYGLFLRVAKRAAEAPIILVNTFRELEDDLFAELDKRHGNVAGQMPKVIPIGPLFPSPAFSQQDSATDEPDAVKVVGERILRFLEKQAPRSVLYLAFGSLGMLAAGSQLEEIALGLEASEQPFVWIAGSARPGGPTIDQLLPPGFLERTKERGMVVTSWAPQTRILEHPSTGAYLCHGGWNSVLEGIAAGLPLLSWPQRAEQKMNRRFLVDVVKVAAEFKVGEDGKVLRAEFERVVRLVMQQEEGRVLHSNMQPLKEAALRNATSVEGLKTFISLCEDHCS